MSILKKRKIAEDSAEYEENSALELSAEEEARLKHAKKLKRRRTMRFWDRVAGFIIVTVLVVGCSCLGLEYVIVKGPSPALGELFINTMYETRRFRFIPQLFLTADEVAEIRSTEEIDKSTQSDTSLIHIPTEEEVTEDGVDAYGLADEDGDGIIFKEVKGNGYMGYMTVILDPTRVFVGMPDNYGGVGLTLEQMVQKYEALGGINAGGFKDDGGGGFGGLPEGLTIIDGTCYNPDMGMGHPIAGLDKDGVLHVGYYTYDDCIATNIVNAVSFGPILISNGEPAPPETLASSVNPRTAIGQRGDGAIIMLVIDGRQVHSIGATYQDMVDILLDHGAVNAINMDGGSSTVMHYGGVYVNSCSADNGQPRPLPNAFLFK
ncbi:MAG: phosphodiester glycosidase family protein [Oscillospiraceae bacterium]|nr:phosphodiester glycosidase family protein [Oscillospiraceae bacterium]